MYSYIQRQISQSVCKISSNCGKKKNYSFFLSWFYPVRSEWCSPPNIASLPSICSFLVEIASASATHEALVFQWDMKRWASAEGDCETMIMKHFWFPLFLLWCSDFLLLKICNLMIEKHRYHQRHDHRYLWSNLVPWTSSLAIYSAKRWCLKSNFIRGDFVSSNQCSQRQLFIIACLFL